jgi:RNA polymerase sigma-70 factor (family 1)
MKRTSLGSPASLLLTQKTCAFPGLDEKKFSVEALMQRILLDDDYQAFQALFNRMYVPLCTFSMRFVKLREVAEEVVSDVFCNIWRNRKVITVKQPKAYLFTAVRNRAVDHIRSAKNIWCTLEEAADLPASAACIHESLECDEINLHLNASISMLPKQCRTIYELSRDEGLKYREIAEELSISIKTVETQMGKALKHVRKHALDLGLTYKV